MSNAPQLILRLGSHAEKDYIIKVSKKLDGIIVGANLIEATAGATSALLCQKLGRLPYYIDPMTYVFGIDLEGIKSEQQQKGPDGKKKPVRTIKRSYKALARRLSQETCSVIKSDKPLDPLSLQSSEVFCREVISYQRDRIREELNKDPEYAGYAANIPDVSAVFSPYFYIPSDDEVAWKAFLQMSRTAVSIEKQIPVHSVLCADPLWLDDDGFIENAAEEIAETGVQGTWLWFSKLDEWDANLSTLKNLRRFVERLKSKGLQVYSRHGGYFSLLLSKFGMSGTCHGIGYGERKDVLQIEGPPNAPVVNYYLPDIHRRFGVPDIERCFSSMKISTPEDFHRNICACTICQGVVKSSIAEFRQFGETHLANGASKRPTQTPAAAKRCRFHFLINRIREKEFVGHTDLSILIDSMRTSRKKWQPFSSIMRIEHIQRWIDALTVAEDQEE